MTFKGLHINLAEVAMVLTALGALITAWRGHKAAKNAEKGKDDAENSSRD